MLLNTNWALRTRVKGLDNPIAVAFLAAGDFFVIEKDTGRVKRFRPDLPEEIVLDLAVNSASERGLLGIALHPDFPSNPGVYLYWSCSAPEPSTPFFPVATTCPDPPALGAD